MSGSSVSSLGSSANGSHLDVTNLAPGEDHEVFEERHWLFKVFSVLYTLGKERPLTGPKYAFLRIFLNSLQLWLLTVVPHYGWHVNPDITVWRIVSFQSLGEFLEPHGYKFYLVLLYMFVTLLAVSVGVSAWLAYCLANNRTAHAWLVKGLRWYGLIFTQVFYVTSLTLLLVALDCNYFSVPSNEVFINRIFPDHKCWEMPHLVQVGVSVVCIVFFVVMAGAMLVSEMELNPLTRNFMAINNTRVEGIGFILITAATLASVMVTSVKALSIMYVAVFLLLYYFHIKWVPFIHNELNYARCGAYAAVLYSSVLLSVLAFSNGTHHSRVYYREEELPPVARTMTLALWAGLGPAALVGAFVCFWRLRYFSGYVVGLFRDLEASEASTSTVKFPYRFRDAREVEIAARCARRWLDEDTVDPDAMALCETIIKAGMTQLPHDSMMIILYSSFLIDVQGSYQSGYAQLQAVKQRSPGPMERFAIYSREQDHSSRATSGGAVDLINYVEFQRTHRVVTRAHKEALIAIRSFWGLLLRSAVDIDKLYKALHNIELAIRTAERSYRTALGRHSSNTRLMRLYGKFLETVKLDPWGAAKWFAEADSLEELSEHTKDVLGGLDLGVLPRDVAMAAQGNMAMGDGVMLIFINAQGIIQAASPQVHVMLGYGKNELQGRDVGIIMPPPFGDHHTAYVRNYVQTGTSTMLDRSNEFIALTKNRTICPIRMVVTKVTGLSEDSVFMGLLEAITHPKDEGRIWLLSSGAVVAADERACDWLGYPLAEIMGGNADDFVVDQEVVQGILKRSKVAEPTVKIHVEKEHRASILEGLLQRRVWSMDAHVNPSFTGGPKSGRDAADDGMSVVHRPHMAWVHKYGDHVPFQTTFTPGALGSVRFMVVTLRRITTAHPRAGPSLSAEMLLVADNKGRVLHVTAALAAALGRPADTIRAGGMEFLIPNPVGTLHGAWLQMLSVPQTQGTSLDAPPPPHSCRSGVPVYLSGYNPDQGPVKVPFKLHVENRLVPGGGSRIHVISLQHLTEEQATSERCLRLRLDLSGTVISAGPTPEELYGVHPTSLVGKNIQDLVDLFQMEDIFKDQAARRESGASGISSRTGGSGAAAGLALRGTADGAAAPGGSTGNGGRPGSGQSPLLSGMENVLRDARSREITRLLIKLTKRSAEAEGISWRVGVTLPPDETDAEEFARMAHVLGPGEQRDLVQLLGARVVPAVMRIRLVRKQPQTLQQQRQQRMLASPALSFGMSRNGRGGSRGQETPTALQRDMQSRLGNSSRQADRTAFGSYDGYSSPLETAPSGDWGPTSVGGTSRKSGIAGSPLQRAGTSNMSGQGQPVAGSSSRGQGGGRGGGGGAAALCPSLCLEVELWRADLLSGVVEVDEAGKVLRTDAAGTPDIAGLVLGSSRAGIMGANIGDLVPLPAGGVAALLEAPAAPGGAESHHGGAGAIRGGLRVRRGAKGYTIGHPVSLRTRHGGDGCLLNLTAQAVRCDGMKATLFLMLRPDKPVTVQGGFVRWLRDSDTGGLARSTQLGVQGAGSGGVMDAGGGSGGGGTGPGGAVRQAADVSSTSKSPPGIERIDSLPGFVPSGTDLHWPAAVASAATPRFSTPLLVGSQQETGSAPGGVLGRASSSPQLWMPPRPPAPPQLAALGAMRVTVNRGSSKPGVAVFGEGDAEEPPSASVSHALSPVPAGGAPVSPVSPTSLFAKKTSPLAAVRVEDAESFRVQGSQFSTRSGRSSVMIAAMQAKADPGAPGANESKKLLDSKQRRVQSWVVSSGRDHGINAKMQDTGQPAQAPQKMTNIPELGGGGGSESPGGVAGSSEEGDRQSSSDGGVVGSLTREGTGRPTAADAGERRGLERQESAGASSMGDEAGAHTTDYSAGRRFKRLTRLLNSPLAQQPSKRVWAHGLLATGLLVLAHVVTFVLMLTHTQTDRQQVEALENAAWACRSIHNIAITGRALEAVLSDSWYVPGIPTFKGPRDAAVQELLDELYASAMLLKARHHGVYLGFGKPRQLPTDYELRDLWNLQVLNVTLFYDQNDPDTQLLAIAAQQEYRQEVVEMGLWDAGNLYLEKALEVYQNVPELELRGVNFSTWSAWRFIQANGMSVLFPGYAQTLDAMVEITAKQLRVGYTRQLIFLIAEGCVLCLLAAVYMWTTAQQFSWSRFELFNIFMHVPIGLTRGLAQMSIVLEPGEEEDDGEEGLLNAATDAQGGGGAGQSGTEGEGGGAPKQQEKPERQEKRSTMVFTLKKKSTEEDWLHSKLHMVDGSSIANLILRALHRITSCLHFSKTGDSRACTKRKLLPSWRMPLLLASPVALWALVVIVFSVVCVDMLRGMDAPIATLNIVITFVLRFQRVLYYTLETCTGRSWAAMAGFKATLRTELAAMNTEYSVMLYGSGTVPDASNNTHFKLATTGVLFSGESKPASVMYYVGQCLCANQSLCQPPGSPYYEATHNGLDVLVKAQVSHVESLLKQPLDSTGLNSSDFKFIWSTARTDTEGGLEMLNQRFYETVINNLRRAQTLQIVLFVMAWVWALWYLLAQLRPLLHRSRAEMRRMAELLCQLPGEMDIEALVSRAIGVQQPPPPPAGKPSGHSVAVGGRSFHRRAIQFHS
ncbi:hypothetical protein Agub_g9292 [Astrephomene gubernaculifera]|uniref:PAS domain-containing protein n=1 Tax=Astrephomene gubernaculifera TaxID=47775 RepID=A0AAD3DUX7_9CHLO|nr:hypothetical protein Agub_g9292 [Astrephomene gubernaculifera]